MLKKFNSIKNNIWSIKLDNDLLDKIVSIQKTYNLSYLSSFVLTQREVEFEAIKNILNNNIDYKTLNVDSIKNFTSSVEKLSSIIKNKQKIGIVSDYDVDGISSAVILTEALDALNVEYALWIPNRRDGYGVNESTIKFFADNAVDLIISLDCGSGTIELLNSSKLPCVIIDHHRCCYENTFENINLINPNNIFYKNEEFSTLCAATLTFLFVYHLLKQLNHSIEIMETFFDLCALATVCDIMILNDINKYFVIKGLKKISDRVGLYYLIVNAKIKYALNEKDLGFKLGPRINATGRIDNAFISYNLLKTKSTEEAVTLVNKIEKINNSRKILQQKALDEAIIEAEKQKDDNIIVVFSNDWNVGIIGIVAARIQDLFKKPCIAGFVENGIIKASARSHIVNIGYLIEKALDLKIITSGGGHAQAAGLSFEESNYQKFKEFLEYEIQNTEQKIKINKIDALITIEQIDPDFKMLAPFGNGNSEIIIMLEDIIISKNINKIKYHIITLMQNFHTISLFIFENSTFYKECEEYYNNQIKFNCILKLDMNGFHEIVDLILI